MQNSRGILIEVGRYYKQLSGDGEAKDLDAYEVVEIKDTKAKLVDSTGFGFWCKIDELYISTAGNFAKKSHTGPIQTTPIQTKLDAKVEAGELLRGRSYEDSAKAIEAELEAKLKADTIREALKYKPVTGSVQGMDGLEPLIVKQLVRSRGGGAVEVSVVSKSTKVAAKILDNMETEAGDIENALKHYANSNESRRLHFGASGRDYKYTEADMIAFVKFCDNVRGY